MRTCKMESCGGKTMDTDLLCYYHAKMSKGLIDPVDTYLTKRELTTLFSGRGHRDGRRLDQYRAGLEPRKGL